MSERGDRGWNTSSIGIRAARRFLPNRNAVVSIRPFLKSVIILRLRACFIGAAVLLTLALFSSVTFREWLEAATETAPAWGIEGLPGSTWGELSYDDDRLVGAGAMGFVNQGIDWVKLPGGITLNTFLEFRYRLRNENRDYYNAYGEAVGLELKKSVFRLGTDYYWERFPNLGERSNKLQFYLSWFYDWDLMKKH